jgi:hypothetical protein
MSPLVYSLANEKLVYESEVVKIEPELVSVAPVESSVVRKITPESEVKKKVVQSTSKKQIKGSKFVFPPQEIKVIIDEKANKYGVDPIVMKAISFCESDYNAKAKNINTSGSKDSGIAQINDFHLPELKKLGLNRDNIADAYEFMAILIARNGLEYPRSDYRHSKECWDVAVKVARN